jgi:hypothetical protein
MRQQQNGCVVKADRRDPFVVFRLSLAAEITKLKAEYFRIDLKIGRIP